MGILEIYSDGVIKPNFMLKSIAILHSCRRNTQESRVHDNNSQLPNNGEQFNLQIF